MKSVANNELENARLSLLHIHYSVYLYCMHILYFFYITHFYLGLRQIALLQCCYPVFGFVLICSLDKSQYCTQHILFQYCFKGEVLDFSGYKSSSLSPYMQMTS